jgi:hypothetical protein
MIEEGDDVTLVSPSGCDHKDMSGDTLIEVTGSRWWCSACGASWVDKDLVIVNDENPPSLMPSHAAE